MSEKVLTDLTTLSGLCAGDREHSALRKSCWASLRADYVPPLSTSARFGTRSEQLFLQPYGQPEGQPLPACLTTRSAAHEREDEAYDLECAAVWLRLAAAEFEDAAKLVRLQDTSGKNARLLAGAENLSEATARMVSREAR